MGMNGSSVWMLCLLMALSLSAMATASMKVQGSIFCLSGNSATPLQGARARVGCKTVGGRPFSMVSGPANDHGFYTATSPTGLKLVACKALLHSSPAWNCRFPTDNNGGRKGAPLIAFSPLSQFFSVKPFFYSP
ncbi:hypothetical protein V2J09_016088 [Rumex salicifolius]